MHTVLPAPIGEVVGPDRGDRIARGERRRGGEARARLDLRGVQIVDHAAQSPVADIGHDLGPRAALGERDQSRDRRDGLRVRRQVDRDEARLRGARAAVHGLGIVVETGLGAGAFRRADGERVAAGMDDPGRCHLLQSEELRATRLSPITTT